MAPYADKVHTMAGTGAWESTSALEAGGTAPSLGAAWAFATACTSAVWRALMVSLLVAAGLDSLLNPAELVFLFLVAPWEWGVTRLLVGAFSGWLSQFASLSDHVGVLTVVVAAVIGTLLVVPTGGEIPVLLGLSALGAGAGMLGVLLVTLPALSLPSMVMVARSLSVRVTAPLAGAVAGGGLVAGAAHRARLKPAALGQSVG